MKAPRCPDRAQFTACAEGRLSPTAAESTEKHLSACAECDACIQPADFVFRLRIPALKKFEAERRIYLAEPAYRRMLKKIEKWRAPHEEPEPPGCE
jgi:anti-sigma factor RsiW